MKFLQWLISALLVSVAAGVGEGPGDLPFPDEENGHAFVMGEGGEFSQWHMPPLTTNGGLRIGVGADDNSFKANVRGPTLMEDFLLREKIMHFDHERIPERVVHARGSGAHGFFEAYGGDSISNVTTATFLTEAQKRTEVFVRFSTVLGGAGSNDMVRDVRGFAIRFYTDQGNFDLVGNNIPVFFIQDAMKFPDLVHAAKMEPDRAFPQDSTAHHNLWDFISLMPESMHMIMWAMSDRTLPRSFRTMQGFGVNTYTFLNEEGGTTFVKFHLKPSLGLQSVLWDEAVKISGADHDYHRRDLWDAIESGNYPEWEFGVQLFTEEEADALEFDILDATKVIPEELVPVQPVGRLVLNRNPSNFFTETEEIAFDPSKVVPGIGFSNDPLLQGRLFSYFDTQLTRLGGPNFDRIPINRPHCPWRNMQRDGFMRHWNPPGRLNYAPHSQFDGAEAYGTGTGTGTNDTDGTPGDDGGTGIPPSDNGTNTTDGDGDDDDDGVIIPVDDGSGETDGEQASSLNATDDRLPYVDRRREETGITTRNRSVSFSDHYSQARLFYLSQTEVEQLHIAQAFIFELSLTERIQVQRRMLAHLVHIDQTLASRVALGLGIDLSTVQPAPTATAPRDDLPLSPALSILRNQLNDTIEGRVVGCLVHDGADATLLADLRDQVEANNAKLVVIGESLRNISLNDDSMVYPDRLLQSSPSVLFDAVVVMINNQSESYHLGFGNNVLAMAHFIVDAFQHMKVIGYTGESAQFIQTALGPILDLSTATDALSTDEGMVLLEGADSVQRYITVAKKLRVWARGDTAGLEQLSNTTSTSV